MHVVGGKQNRLLFNMLFGKTCINIYNECTQIFLCATISVTDPANQITILIWKLEKDLGKHKVLFITIEATPIWDHVAKIKHFTTTVETKQSLKRHYSRLWTEAGNRRTCFGSDPEIKKVLITVQRKSQSICKSEVHINKKERMETELRKTEQKCFMLKHCISVTQWTEHYKRHRWPTGFPEKCQTLVIWVMRGNLVKRWGESKWQLLTVIGYDT